jgi:hypothetical protein
MNEILDTNSSNGFAGNKKLPNANACLVLGIISIATCWLYGIPGLVCGIIAVVLHKKDKRIYLEDPMSYQQSFKNSKAGFICGIIGLCLSAFYVLFFLVALTIIGTAFMNFR